MHLSALQRSVIDLEALRKGNFLNDFVIFLLLCNQLNTIIYVGVRSKELRSNRPDLTTSVGFLMSFFLFYWVWFCFRKMKPLKVAGILAHFSLLYQLWKMTFLKGPA